MAQEEMLRHVSVRVGDCWSDGLIPALERRGKKGGGGGGEMVIMSLVVEMNEYDNDGEGNLEAVLMFVEGLKGLKMVWLPRMSSEMLGKALKAVGRSCCELILLMCSWSQANFLLE